MRTVVWVTPWVNLESVDGQRPPGIESERLHSRPADNYADGALGGHFVRDRGGRPWVGKWWMGTGSLVDFTSPLPPAPATGLPVAGFFLLSFNVDLSVVLARLADLGLADDVAETSVHGVRMAVVRSPEGVRVELIDLPAVDLSAVRDDG